MVIANILFFSMTNRHVLMIIFVENVGGEQRTNILLVMYKTKKIRSTRERSRKQHLATGNT